MTDDIGLKTYFIGLQELIEEEANAKFDSFDPLWYSRQVVAPRQVVAGMNYNVVYQTGPDTKLGVKIFSNLHGVSTINSVYQYGEEGLGEEPAETPTVDWVTAICSFLPGGLVTLFDPVLRGM